MNPYITNVFLDKNAINYLKQNISKNASKPLKEGILTARVNYNASTAAAYSPSLLGDNDFDFLKNIIDEKVFEIIQTRLETYLWWVMKYTGDDYTKEHSHQPVSWVAVYYIEAPKNSGKLYFPTINLSIKPKTGMLVIHTGDLIHGVKKNTSPNIERYNMVINYK